MLAQCCTCNAHHVFHFTGPVELRPVDARLPVGVVQWPRHEVGKAVVQLQKLHTMSGYAHSQAQLWREDACRADELHVLTLMSLKQL